MGLMATREFIARPEMVSFGFTEEETNLLHGTDNTLPSLVVSEEVDVGFTFKTFGDNRFFHGSWVIP